MEQMQQYFNEYLKDNRGKVRLCEDRKTKVTSYSFEVQTLLTDKNTMPKKYVVMKSWFLELHK